MTVAQKRRERQSADCCDEAQSRQRQRPHEGQGARRTPQQHLRKVRPLAMPLVRRGTGREDREVQNVPAPVGRGGVQSRHGGRHQARPLPRPQLAQKPFRRVAEEWTATKADIKPGTLRRYKRELRIYINPQWGDTPIGDIKTEAIQKWVNQLSEGGYPADRKRGTENTRALKPRSIRNIVRVVMGGVLGHALKQGYITANPMQSVATPRVSTMTTTWYFSRFPRWRICHRGRQSKERPAGHAHRSMAGLRRAAHRRDLRSAGQGHGLSPSASAHPPHLGGG